MEPQWIAEREVDLDEARALIAAAAPGLADARVQVFAAGWDNVAFLVGGRWIFRFPRRAIAVPAMRVEIDVLPSLAAHLPLAVPRPVFVGRPTESYPWPYAGYERIPGDVAAERDLGDATLAAAAEALGEFLRALHATPAAEVRALGAPLDELGRLDVETRLPRALACLDRLAAAGRVAAPDELRDALLAGAPRDRAPRADTLVHGDLDARHVLVDDRGAPCGVIDWGDLHVGDPAVDLALALTFLPPAPSPAREAFRARYGPVDAGTWRAARFRALVHALVVLEWAAETGRPRIGATAARGLARASAE